MRIYIPTYRRVHDQRSVSYISDRWLRDTYLVAVPDEVDTLRTIYPSLKILECPAKGIGPTRQWILNQHDIDKHGPQIMMMDDDLQFYKRRTDDPTKFTQFQTGAEFDVMMEEFLELFLDSPLIGISNRSGANRDTSRVRSNTRMHDLFGIDLTVTRKHGFRIDRIKFMEDFDFILQHLTAGYETLCLNSYCKGDRGSNIAGGCSEYRDAAGQEAAALDLAMEWPEFVKLRKVKAKGAGMWAERTDVTVQWQKAFTSSGS
jgi:hypothetical protein